MLLPCCITVKLRLYSMLEIYWTYIYIYQWMLNLCIFLFMTVIDGKIISLVSGSHSWLVSGPSQIARFMGPTWGPSGADRTQVGPMLAPWTLLSEMRMSESETRHPFLKQMSIMSKWAAMLEESETQNGCACLTHRGLVMPYCNINLGQH